MKSFDSFGISVPDILLPESIDLTSWSVIACDQYTQDRAYWEKAAEIAGEKPSALHLIFPEVYLNDADKDQRICSIKETMRRYLEQGVFAEPKHGCMYIERTTAYGRTRKGLVLAVDLDCYEWKPFSKALIRATEATVPERIPPRMKIRTGAPLETPHIMLLADDADALLVEKAGVLAKKNAPVYDGDLQQKSGHITGWLVDSDEGYQQILSALETLARKGRGEDGSVFLFAVGDGNHSLATAKAVWEEHKKSLLAQGATEEALTNSPVRYALVEVVNIYDQGLTFEPIHRVVFGADGKALTEALAGKLAGRLSECESAEALEKAVAEKSSEGARYGFVYLKDAQPRFILLQTAVTDLAIAALQPALDEAVASLPGVTIDYIHGSEETLQLGMKEGQLGILLPPIAKDSFFATISARGPLPRKSFSMGEASEKRFYVEARRLFD